MGVSTLHGTENGHMSDQWEYWDFDNGHLGDQWEYRDSTNNHVALS
jgi:hypothetical protein